MKVKYRKLDKAEGPLVIMSNVEGAVYDELVEVEMPNHERRTGKVVQINKDKVIIQVFQGISGISLNDVSQWRYLYQEKYWAEDLTG